MDFNKHSTKSLERISADARYPQHHAEIEAILRTREGHLSIKRGVEVLTEVAKAGRTTNYKVFFEECVGGEVKWNHTKMGQTAKHLGKLMRFCMEHGLPLLSALVVNIQTEECGEGFFKEMTAIGLASSLDDPKAVSLRERERCWAWAKSL